MSAHRPDGPRAPIAPIPGPRKGPIIKTIQIRPLPVESSRRCDAPTCNGRRGRWYFPQADTFADKMRIVACDTHLPHIARTVETWYVEAEVEAHAKGFCDD